MSPCQGNLPRKDIGPTAAEDKRLAARPPREAGSAAPGLLPTCLYSAGSVGPGRARGAAAGPAARRPPSPGQRMAAAPAKPSPLRPRWLRESGGRTVSLGRLQEALGNQSVLCCAAWAPAVRSNVNCREQPLRGDREPGESPEPSRAKAAIQANFKTTPEELQN